MPYRVVTGKKENITVLLCFNAAGQFIPLYIFFSGNRASVGFNPLRATPGSAFAGSEKGYMDEPTFCVDPQSFHSPFASCKASK